MKKSIKYIFLVYTILLIGCSERNYIKTVVDYGITGDPSPVYTYYLNIVFDIEGNKTEYLMPVEFLNTYLHDSTIGFVNTKLLWKNLFANNRCLFLDSNDIFIPPDIKYKIQHSNFQDSLSKLSTDSILDKYFINKCMLRTNNLDVNQQRDIIYILVKRREFIFIYTVVENIPENKRYIYYGKLLKGDVRKNIEKRMKNE